MRFHNVVPFTKWLLKKVFGGVIELYSKYDSMVVKQPFLSLLPTVWFTVCSFIPIAIISSTFTQVMAWWLSSVALIFLNYFRIILREQYKQFKAERQELFTLLKDGK